MITSTDVVRTERSTFPNRTAATGQRRNAAARVGFIRPDVHCLQRLDHLSYDCLPHVSSPPFSTHIPQQYTGLFASRINSVRRSQ